MGNKRIEELDGLRGIAIILVVLFHYFTRWAPSSGQGLYPYGDTFSHIPVVRDGAVGVFLFFIISGFVIFQTLQRAPSIADFALRRADRLVLPMIVLSTITFVLLAGPLGNDFMRVHIADILPSWTFTTPNWWRWVNPDVNYIDGAYWTLFIEVRFYILMALLWFFLPRALASVFLTACALASLGLFLLCKHFALDGMADVTDYLLFPPYIALFASGVVYSEIMRDGLSRKHVVLLALLIPASLAGLRVGLHANSGLMATLAWATLFHAVFIALVLRLPLTRHLGWKPLVFIGQISYSLYLLHENVGVALLAKLPVGLPNWVYLACLAGLIAVMIVAATFSQKYLESRKLLSGRLRRKSFA